MNEVYLMMNSKYHRQLIRLLNGWIVVHVFEGNAYIKSYISKDDGFTWNNLTLKEDENGKVSTGDSKGIRSNCR